MTPISVIPIIAMLALSSQAKAPPFSFVPQHATPQVLPEVLRGSKSLHGTATWYGTGPGRGHAAAGPLLRSALGPDWRGTVVYVTHGSRTVRVALTDWCLCTGSRRRVIDLSDEDFGALAPLSAGVIRVSVDPSKGPHTR